MPPQPLEISETLRNLWELAEALDRQAGTLAEAAPRLVCACRRAAERHVGAQPPEPLSLVATAGALRELCRQLAATDEALADALSELPLTWRPELPSPLTTRADEALARRVTSRIAS